MSELHRQGILTGFAVVRRIDGENVFLPSGQLCRVVHPGAVDFHGMDAAQGTDQPFLVELTVIHFHEVHHTLQDCGTEGIGFALPCVHNQPQSLAVDFLAHLVVQLECSAYAADAVVAQLQAVIVEVQTHPVGGCEECHGKSILAHDLGTELDARRQRCSVTVLLCEEQGFLLHRQTRIHLAENREVFATVAQDTRFNGVLTVRYIIENPNPHGKSYNKWLGDKAKPSHREQLRMMIDQALEQKPTDFDELLKMLSEMGCEVTRRGKAIRLKAPGWKNIARMDEGLGTGYSEAEIRAVLAGKKQHTPRKKSTVQAKPPKVNLLVDIQEKLRAGKGAGYARWAKVFNLKQMAQTMNFLTEHNLLEYAVLEEKAAAATARHNELSAQIKAAEKRMAEIAVLRTHIINYAKTREIYVAYRQAGYSMKFRQEHEAEILLHQAAKNAFDDMGVKKLPKVKELQTEYAKLLEEKKKIYAEYRRSREEMRELLTAKANVDRLLKMDEEQKQEKEKDHDQR